MIFATFTVKQIEKNKNKICLHIVLSVNKIKNFHNIDHYINMDRAKVPPVNIDSNKQIDEAVNG